MVDDDLIWERVKSEGGPELPLFRVRFDFMRHPQRAQTFKRLVLEAEDWVNVVALTSDGRSVMVEQYRFGIGELTLEPTAGMVSAGEEPLAAAKRELLEETGYGGGQWHYLGAVQPNPATQNNLCHHWLAQDVVAVQPPAPEDGEAIRVHLMTLEELRGAIAAGRLRHTLALSALSRVYALWEPRA
ncbi:MAG: NUDIX hydrolase [Gammaproteobacteria bacterium]|nr:NUDIX hydrolase [Gammaproteobacteria bacterium]